VPAWATEQHEKKRRKAEAAGQAALQRSQAEAARRLQQRATGDETIQIKMVSQDGTELYFKLKGRTPLSQSFDVACQRFGISREKLRFLFDGNVIYDGNTTPQDLEMEDGDTLDVVVAQAGC
jgi:small ubiquitin-related modifier